MALNSQTVEAVQWLRSLPDPAQAKYAEYVAAFFNKECIDKGQFKRLKYEVLHPEREKYILSGGGRGEPTIATERMTAPIRIKTAAAPTMERHIVLSDLHYREYNERVYDPDANAYIVRRRTAHDPRALEAAEVFMREWKPTHIFLNGDMLDFPQLSRFDKEDYESDGLQGDIEGLRVILKRIRSNHPNAEIHYLLGNHEERLERFLRANAPALRWLTSLTYHAIFDVKELGITIYPYRERVPILPGVLEITHGDKVAQKSGYTAQRMLEAGISGVSGHVHRLGMVFKTTRTGMTLWAEGGCLCSLEPSYASSPNWQQGIVTLFVDRANARFHADLVPIINGRIVYAGDVYEAA